MLSKSKIKLVRSLELKKFRKELQLFVAEGHKAVEDLLPAFDCTLLLARGEWLERQADVAEKLAAKGVEIIEVTEDELLRTSLMKSPQDVLAVFRQREDSADVEVMKRGLCLGLDGVQDPGNLGTIIRIADWFGIKHVFCSPQTADVYSPKTVQATMGALARVHVHYIPMDTLLQSADADIPIYGTFLDGHDIYDSELSGNGLIVMGNEGNGISKKAAPFIRRRLFVPNFPPGQATSESLNVAVATAIVCAEFRRREAKR